MDDEETFGYTKRLEYATAVFELSGGKLRNTVSVGAGWSKQVDAMAQDRMVERIILMGIAKSPKKISLEDGTELSFTFNSQSKVVVVRKPEVSTLQPWTMVIS